MSVVLHDLGAVSPMRWMAKPQVAVDHSSTAALLAAEGSAMNLLHSQHDPAFGRFVGTLALAVISVLCILLGSCISDATAAGDARVLDAKIMLPAQLRQVPQPTGDQTPITPLETAGTSPMN